MAVYWTTFRLKENATYDRRYEALVATIKSLASKWWYEPSSFFLFESDSDINAVASAIADSVDQAVDLVLVGMPDFKSARVVGRVEDDDLFSLMPFTKKA